MPAKKYGIGGNILFGKILWTCTVYTVGIIIQPLSTIHLQLNLVHWYIWCKHCPCFNSIPHKLQNRGDLHTWVTLHDIQQKHIFTCATSLIVLTLCIHIVNGYLTGVSSNHSVRRKINELFPLSSPPIPVGQLILIVERPPTATLSGYTNLIFTMDWIGMIVQAFALISLRRD